MSKVIAIPITNETTDILNDILVSEKFMEFRRKNKLKKLSTASFFRLASLHVYNNLQSEDVIPLFWNGSSDCSEYDGLLKVVRTSMKWWILLN